MPAGLILVIPAIAIASLGVSVGAAGCSVVQINAGLCSITPSTTNTTVILDGTIGGTSGGDSGDGTGTGSWNEDFDSAAAPEPECVFSEIEPDRCYRNPPNPTDPLTAAPAVTITDVAAFAPTFAAALSEPSGWAIAGLPANLVGPAGAVTVGGTLLGSPADVRFVPVAWRWDYGDDSTATLGVAGSTWAASGLPEFSATSTSHVWTASGIHRVALAVVAVAEYRIAGGPWIPVAGSLTLPVSEFDIVVATADTVLVERDCRANPSGPGC